MQAWPVNPSREHSLEKRALERLANAQLRLGSAVRLSCVAESPIGRANEHRSVVCFSTSAETRPSNVYLQASKPRDLWSRKSKPKDLGPERRGNCCSHWRRKHVHRLECGRLSLLSRKGSNQQGE